MNKPETPRLRAAAAGITLLSGAVRMLAGYNPVDGGFRVRLATRLVSLEPSGRSRPHHKSPSSHG
jgi:hypothetical protein